MENEDEQKRMSNQMSFIVEQQARIDANMETLTKRMDGLAQHMTTLTDAMISLTRIVERHENKLFGEGPA